jgi:membrane fusion protein (multidrug efflux system)
MQRLIWVYHYYQPGNGVIGSLPYKLGSLVNGNTTEPLTTVYNTANIYAYFAMNEKQLLDLNRDSTGTKSLKAVISKMPNVSLILSDGTTYEHTGRVETVNGLINTATGAANVRADFVNPRGLDPQRKQRKRVRIPNVIKELYWYRKAPHMNCRTNVLYTWLTRRTR